MALTHLVDTSVLTRLDRSNVRAALEPLTVGGRVARAGIPDLEIGFSARNLREWTRLTRALAAFSLIALNLRLGVVATGLPVNSRNSRSASFSSRTELPGDMS